MPVYFGDSPNLNQFSQSGNWGSPGYDQLKEKVRAVTVTVTIYFKISAG